jgi:hypothetical protein
MTGEFVTLVNRTKEPLSVMVDGRQYVLKPGDNTVDRMLVQYARNQHRIMGTEDPGNPLDFQSLVGWKERGDDITPAKQSQAVEALDRRLLADRRGRKAKPVKTGRGVSRLSLASDLPADANFSNR